MIKKGRKLLRIIFSILVLAAGPYIFLYFFINERGKDIFLNTLKTKYRIEASLTDMTLSFPFKITLVDFKAKNIKFLGLTANIRGFNPLMREIIIGNLYIKGLNVSIDKNSIGLILKNKLSAEPGAKHSVAKEGAGGAYYLKINNITFDSASFALNYSELEHPLKLAIKDLSGTVKRFRYPSLDKMDLNLNASLEVNGKEAKNSLSVSGWVDWLRKDMDLLCMVKNVDYFMFKEYYPPFWQPDNLDIKEARLSLNSHLVSKNDSLFIDYYIVLNKIVFNDNPEDESKIKSLRTIIALFTRGGQTVAHFGYHTKMSKPEFNVNSIGEGLLTQLKSMDTSNIIDSMNRLFGKAQDAAVSGVKNIKGITIDPVVRGLQQAGEEFLKNIKSILGMGKDKNKDSGK
ncbi:MAG: hypothetical protein B1H08_05725 [Candidatus Omnitrophica bacterium 4484_171]|nr:MAG: hypothetical protein B1H08_05725 [Candidatus Omnitrophica bacterium 4484_171]